MKINRDTFFSSYRGEFGKLDQGQVDGLNFLLGKFEQDTFSLRQIAYILATVYHETAKTFEPIKEYRARAGSKGRANQDRYWLTGFYGRGYVQLTWEDNYRKFGIADHPEKALEPETAYEILSRGMKEGMFTGKKLGDYVNGKVDYRSARKAINGLDKADLIAGYARDFESILLASDEQGVVQHNIEIHAPSPSIFKVHPPPDPAGPTKTEPPQVSTVQSKSEKVDEKSEASTQADSTVTVQKVAQSLGSQIMSGGTIGMGVLTAIVGAFLGVVKNPYAFTALILGCCAMGLYAWNRSKERQLKLQLDLNAKAASPQLNTVDVQPPNLST